MKRLLLSMVLVALILLPAHFAYTNLKDGLVLHLPFDEGNGNTAKDQSKNGNDATLDGVDWIVGRHGKAIELEGEAGSCGVIPHNDSLVIEGEITIMMWLNIHEYKAGDIAQPLDKATHNGGEHKTYSMMIDQGRITGRFGSDQNRQGYSSDAQLALDKWEHAAVTLDANAYTVYLNGEAIATEAVAYRFEGTNDFDLNIGCAKDRPNYSYKGGVDDVRIYRRALSAAEINEAMSPVTAVDAKDKLAITWAGIKVQ